MPNGGKRGLIPAADNRLRSARRSRVSYWDQALMGTAAVECRCERAGDGVSPAAGATDQITPEPLEERPFVVKSWLSRTCTSE